MTEAAKVFSFDDLRKPACTGKTFEDVPAYGGSVKIATLSSKFMIEWLEENDDPIRKKQAGLRLLVKSLVDPVTLEPLPEEQLDEMIEVFRLKDSRENSKVVAAALKLNGLSVRKRTTEVDDEKNGSSEAVTVASPTDSPLPQVD